MFFFSLKYTQTTLLMRLTFLKFNYEKRNSQSRPVRTDDAPPITSSPMSPIEKRCVSM